MPFRLPASKLSWLPLLPQPENDRRSLLVLIAGLPGLPTNGFSVLLSLYS
jgi:hypothetical protein